MENQQKKILILYTSHTHGHKAVAENIGFYLEQAGYEVKLSDVLKVQSGRLVEGFTQIHRWVNEYWPSLWSFLYLSESFTKLTLPYRVKLAGKNYQNTRILIDEFKPDMVITTQVSASAIVAYLKQENLYNGLFGIAFSDFHLHPYWLYYQADFYLANIQEQKQEMQALGVPEQKIFVCGITLKPENLIDASQIKLKFGVQAGQKVALMSSGSMGMGISEQLLQSLSAIENLKIIVICGNNNKLFQNLSSKYSSASNIVILGYYANMEELYSIADIFLTKPGGLSMAEGLRKKIPMLIFHMLPGQEELNYSYLAERGLVMPEPLNIAEEVEEELRRGSFKKVLQENPHISELFPEKEVLLNAVKSVFYGSK